MNLRYIQLDVETLDIKQIQNVMVESKPIYPMHYLMSVFYRDGSTVVGTVRDGDFYRLNLRISNEVPGFESDDINDYFKEMRSREEERKVEIDAKRELMI